MPRFGLRADPRPRRVRAGRRRRRRVPRLGAAAGGGAAGGVAAPTPPALRLPDAGVAGGAVAARPDAVRRLFQLVDELPVRRRHPPALRPRPPAAEAGRLGRPSGSVTRLNKVKFFQDQFQSSIKFQENIMISRLSHSLRIVWRTRKVNSLKYDFWVVQRDQHVSSYAVILFA